MAARDQLSNDSLSLKQGLPANGGPRGLVGRPARSFDYGGGVARARLLDRKRTPGSAPAGRRGMSRDRGGALLPAPSAWYAGGVEPAGQAVDDRHDDLPRGLDVDGATTGVDHAP